MIEAAIKGILVGEMIASSAMGLPPKINTAGEDFQAIPSVIQIMPKPFPAEASLVINSPIPSLSETPSPTILSTPEATLVPESTVKPNVEPKILSEVNTGIGSEPTVAVSPYNSNLMAVTHQRVAFKDGRSE